MSVTAATHQPAVTHLDTRRDKKETARRAAFPQPAGHFAGGGRCWVRTNVADGRILGDLGTHGLADCEGCVEIGYSLAPSARGQGIGTAAVAAFVRRLAEEPGIRRLTAVTGAQNTASRRLLERQGFHLTGPLPGTDEVRYTRNLSSPVKLIARTGSSAPFGRGRSDVGKRRIVGVTRGEQTFTLREKTASE